MAAIICDSSPLVHLAAINRFALLKLLYSNLFIPDAVRFEVAIAGRGRPGSFELENAIQEGWIQVRNPTLVNAERVELAMLDSGEASAIALALDIEAETILLDELRGRSVARQLGLHAIGTLGVLIEAKRRGYIVSFRAELDQIDLRSQMQLSNEIRQLALRMANE